MTDKKYGKGDFNMKQPKKLTRVQKIMVSAAKLNPDNWMLVSENRESIRIINKKSEKQREINKSVQ